MHTIYVAGLIEDMIMPVNIRLILNLNVHSTIVMILILLLPVNHM